MKNLLRCHFNYLINKTTFIILIITLVFSILSYIVSLSHIEQSRNYIENNLNYHLNSSFMITLIANFLAIFIFGFSFLSKSDQYVLLILPRNISRECYFLSKFLVIAGLLLIFIYLELLFYLLVASIGYSQFVFSFSIIIYFVNLFVQIIFYGLMSLILVQLLNNIYTVIIPFSLHMIGTIVNEGEDNKLKFINYVIPNFSNNRTSLINSGGYFIVIVMLLLIINLFIYKLKDL